MIDRIARDVLNDLTRPEVWFEKDSFPCPICGRALMLGGRKGWLIRRLRMHFKVCRPLHRVLKLREMAKLQTAAAAGRFHVRGSSHGVPTTPRPSDLPHVVPAANLRANG